MRLIDADETIREIVWNSLSESGEAIEATAKAIRCIENMPSIERKKGKWIGRWDDAFECSECHAVIEGDEVYWRNNYFCYHCGAKMERKEE